MSTLTKTRTLTKSYPVQLKSVDAVDGTFEAIVSVFGNVDLGGDRVVKGAFTKSLQRWKDSGDPIPVIWSHQWNDPDAHIGRLLDYTENDVGLYVKGQMDMDRPFAEQVFHLMSERRVKEFSFAYDVMPGGEHRAKDGANDLTELDLIETGPTLKGLNPDTELWGTKRRGLKAAIASHSTDTTDEAWDGPKMEANLSTDAGASTYRKAYAWVDPDKDGDTKAAYKFIHHMVSAEGDVGAANTTGCSTGIGVLNGGRGGTTIPEADIQGVYNHLAKHITDAGSDAPELKDTGEKGRKAWVILEDSYEDQIGDLNSAFDDWAREQFDGICFAYVEATFPDHIVGYVELWIDDWGDGTYYQIPYTETGPDEFTFGDPVEVEISAQVSPAAKARHLKARGAKEGRRNSTADLDRIQTAHDLLVEAGAQCSAEPAEGEANDEEPEGAKSEELSPDVAVVLAEIESLRA